MITTSTSGDPPLEYGKVVELIVPNSVVKDCLAVFRSVRQAVLDLEGVRRFISRSMFPVNCQYFIQIYPMYSVPTSVDCSFREAITNLIDAHSND